MANTITINSPTWVVYTDEDLANELPPLPSREVTSINPLDGAAPQTPRDTNKDDDD